MSIEIFEKINFIKKKFSDELEHNLDLLPIPCPLFLDKKLHLNDMLNNIEKPVTFNINNLDNMEVEIIQSLAKWKRVCLKMYNIELNKGIVCDMKAIRKHENPDATHSILVDQWDWEKNISLEQRNIETLKENVRKIYNSILNTQNEFNKKFNLSLNNFLPNDIYFINSQELEDLYPKLSPKNREKEIANKYKAVFVIGIGEKLKSGFVHDNRSAEYDDWSLNGDILLWSDALNDTLEISSMGIRVDDKSLLKQLKEQNFDLNNLTPYQKQIINFELPYSIGGGIGQSRLIMYILGVDHIGKIQFSVWDEKDKKEKLK